MSTMEIKGVTKVLNINGTTVTAIIGGEIKQLKCKDEADIISKFSPYLSAEQVKQLK